MMTELTLNVRNNQLLLSLYEYLLNINDQQTVTFLLIILQTKSVADQID
jgi:hypothetical protein